MNFSGWRAVWSWRVVWSWWGIWSGYVSWWGSGVDRWWGVILSRGRKILNKMSIFILISALSYTLIWLRMFSNIFVIKSLLDNTLRWRWGVLDKMLRNRKSFRSWSN